MRPKKFVLADVTASFSHQKLMLWDQKFFQVKLRKLWMVLVKQALSVVIMQDFAGIIKVHWLLLNLGVYLADH